MTRYGNNLETVLSTEQVLTSDDRNAVSNGKKNVKIERGRSLITTMLKPDLCENSHASSLIIFSSCFSRGCPFA